VDLPHLRRRRRLALVRAAPRAALVLARRPVVDVAAPAVAPLPATPQFGVERVQDLAVHPAELEPAEDRTDVVLDIARYADLVDASTSSTVRYRSRSWSTVARVFGFRRSSTWFSSRVRTFSASAAASGPGGTISSSYSRRRVSRS
jgi:hypothetical protein